MQSVLLTQIIQPTNNSVKLFSWERFYIATWTLEWEQINFESAEKVTFENKPSRANQEVEVWDIIFAKMQNTKKTLLITEKEKDFIYSSWFFVLRPWKEILSWYLKHFLNSASFLEQKDKNCTWATQKALTLEWLQKIQIPLPPLSHQKQIIQKLDTLTNLINLRKLSIEKTEKLTKSIFIEMFWDPMINEKGWEVKELNNLKTEFRYWTSEKSTWTWLPILRIPNIVSWISLKDLKYCELSQSELEKCLLKHWDVLFVRTNWNPDFVWRSAVFNLEGDYVYASYLIRTRLKLNLINPIYLLEFLRTEHWKKIIKKVIKTSAWQYNINTEGLWWLEIPLPRISLQNKFASIVEKNEENIKKQKESLVKLEELYSGVMQESFRI